MDSRLLEICKCIDSGEAGIEEKCISYFDSCGMQHKRSVVYTEWLLEAWQRCDESFDRKVWAMSDGFMPDKIQMFSLTEENMRDYISDYDYFMMHPLNNHFAFWINDKLTLKYMLQKPLCINEAKNIYLDLMPEYYLYIENDGRYSFLMDAPKNIAKDKDFIKNLVQAKKVLAMKPSNGAEGKGFIKLEYKDDFYFLNGRKISGDAFEELEKNLKGYIVTEYIVQHQDLDKVWPGSICTLRIVACKNWVGQYEGGKTHVFISYARFGSSISGSASNLSSGGVAAAFNFETGEFNDMFYCRPHLFVNREMMAPTHPDTGVSLKGKFLPNWEMVKNAIYAVSDYLSSLEYFGFDVMITPTGVKLCEINTHPSLDDDQVICGPVLKDPVAREFFKKKLEAKYNTLKNLKK